MAKHSALLRKIDDAFNDSNWRKMDALVRQYEDRFEDNEDAMDALLSYLHDPMINMSLPANLGW